jgi:hypothetical protein
MRWIAFFIIHAMFLWFDGCIARPLQEEKPGALPERHS